MPNSQIICIIIKKYDKQNYYIIQKQECIGYWLSFRVLQFDVVLKDTKPLLFGISFNK